MSRALRTTLFESELLQVDINDDPWSLSFGVLERSDPDRLRYERRP